MKLNHERSALLAIFGAKELDIVKFAYFEPFSCGIMSMYNVERYHSKYGIKAIEELFDYIKDVTKFREKCGWNTNLIQFSITNRNEELVEFCKINCCNNTKFYMNFNSGNKIAVFTIECGINNK